MTPDKVREVLDNYRRFFIDRHIEAKRHDDAEILEGEQETLQHCHWMVIQTEILLDQNRIEKAMRWLGFVQGVLWATHTLTIATMKGHNRPG